MKKPLPIGVADYRRLREDGYYFVDKSLMIQDLLEKKTIRETREYASSPYLRNTEDAATASYQLSVRLERLDRAQRSGEEILSPCGTFDTTL